jgi:hypothetical protein
VKSILLGHDEANQPVTLSPEERQAHMHVIGASGSGKSKFMEQMMRGDLDNRQGFCLIDPHGTLYRNVLDYAAHKVLNRDIVLLDLSRPEQVIGFNPFRKGKGDVSVQVDRRIRATLHAWGVENADQTPTLERTLRLVFTTLLELELPFHQAQHLINFESSEIREQLIARLDSKLVQQEWRELLGLKSKDWRSELLSAKNRLFRLLTSTTLTRFFHASGVGIDLAEIIEQGKILLVNLAESDDLSEEASRVFGALLVNEFFEVARRREAPPGRELKPYYLYMDEFQTFVGLDVTAMLDQVRKRKLFTILAHQRFGQLNEDLRDSVLTNCRIKAVFGGLTAEASRMMAFEMFIGDLDSRKLKDEIHQTKFWPRYGRDKVYTRSTSSGRSRGEGENVASGESASDGFGESFAPMGWDNNFSTASFTSTHKGSGMSSMQGHHSNTTDFEGTSEGEADVPIYHPEPFTELSSRTYFTHEEQIMEKTAALKEQHPRHCYIKIHHKKSQLLRVPLIREYRTPRLAIAQYETKKKLAAGAVSSEVVDAAIASEDAKLEALVTQPQGKSVKSERRRTKQYDDLLGRE